MPEIESGEDLQDRVRRYRHRWDEYDADTKRKRLIAVGAVKSEEFIDELLRQEEEAKDSQKGEEEGIEDQVEALVGNWIEECVG